MSACTVCKELLDKQMDSKDSFLSGVSGFKGDSKIANTPAKGQMQVHGHPLSFNALGPVLFAKDAKCGEMKVVDLTAGANMTSEFITMNPFHAIPTLKHGDYVLAESNSILRYMAETSMPKAYPSDPKKSAFIDWAMDRFSLVLYEDAYATLYPILGYAAAPADQAAAGVMCTENLCAFCEVFLKGTFIGGDTPSIADYKVAPFFFAYGLEEVMGVTGITFPERLKRFNQDFADAAKGISVLKEAGGLEEVIKAKVKEGQEKGIFSLLKEKFTKPKADLAQEAPVTAPPKEVDFTAAAPAPEPPAAQDAYANQEPKRPPVLEEKEAPTGGCCGW
jgi:glutathione S-transferase